MLFAGTFAPHGWLLCNGQSMSISQNAALFSLLGTQFGGNGVTTFQVPDLRGRVPVHQGTLLSGSNYAIGQTGGSENVQLTLNQIPPHVHAVSSTPASASSQPATQTDPAGHVFAVPTDGSLAYSPTGAAANVAPTGSNVAHSNLQPYLGINYCMANVGIYPTRN